MIPTPEQIANDAPPARLLVRMIQEDVKNGIPSSLTRCPIANAIKRIYPNRMVRVDGLGILVSGFTYTLSRRALRFIKNYDETWAPDATTPQNFVLTMEN